MRWPLFLYGVANSLAEAITRDSADGSKGSDHRKSDFQPTRRVGTLGRGKLSELKPPTVLKPQALIRWTVRGAQACGSRCAETQDLSARSSGRGASRFRSTPLIPIEKNRPPHGFTSHQTPFCNSTCQRLFAGHGGLQSAAAKRGLDRNRRITTVRVKRLGPNRMGLPSGCESFWLTALA